MAGLIPVAVAVLSLLCGGQSAPVTNCESLIQPIEIQGREQLQGKWMYLAESTDIKGSKLLTKMFVASSWAKITAANESNVINVFQATKMSGSCITITYKMTLENSTISLAQPFTVSEVLLNTSCPDCLVVSSKYTFGSRTHRGLQLMSRRNEVTAAELDEFMKQVECVNLPPPAIMDPNKDVCPDVSPSQETQITDLTSLMNEMGTEVFSLFERLVSSEGGMNALIDMISSSAARIKEN